MSKLPKHYLKFKETFPDVAAAYEALGDAVADAGPLDAKSRELVKIGVAMGARSEGGFRSHVRKALAAGATEDEIRHAVLQATTTIGFPGMMAAMAWVDDVVNPA
jgi:4-carboxymuconolactone decarboxylase